MGSQPHVEMLLASTYQLLDQRANIFHCPLTSIRRVVMSLKYSKNVKLRALEFYDFGIL